MQNVQMQRDRCIYYMDNYTGQMFVELDDGFYEMVIGNDVTNEINPMISKLEMIRAFDPDECLYDEY